MAKRSSFARIEGDVYPTPFAAVPPLIPHLRRERIRTFAEPCCGDGALVRHLETFGLHCTYAGDISAGQDARERESYGGVDAIVTNPPYTRQLMHELITHFQAIAPAWLLLEMDWAATAQAEPFLPSCSTIVVVGRLKLIEGTPHSGKESFGWFRFDARHRGGPVLHARKRPHRGPLCRACTEPLPPARADARYCSNACRQRAYRDRC
jgi:hypothetical protein